MSLTAEATLRQRRHGEIGKLSYFLCPYVDPICGAIRRRKSRNDDLKIGAPYGAASRDVDLKISAPYGAVAKG